MNSSIFDIVLLGLAVLFLAMFATAALFIVVMGQNILGVGQTNLQTSLGKIKDADLEQYSNTIKKGTIIKSSFAMYESATLALLVKTTALLRDVNGDNNQTKTGLDPGKGKYFNYGVLLKGAKTVTLADGNEHIIVDAGENRDSDSLIRKAGEAMLQGTLDIKNGIRKRNYDTSGTVTIGNSELILDNGLFYCQLVRDLTGDYIGIVATQQK